MHALPRSRLGFGFFASMSSSAARVGGGGGGGRDPSNNPAVGRLRELVQRGDAAAVEKAKQISDQEGGPPFNNTVTDYQKVLEPLGFKAILMEDNELAIKPRKGQEKLGRWKRFLPGSSL
uniref:Uncharacterized protein n=1 Tax=Oryza glumipatula TaxID=40148 RepID=A0A0E0A578_9ORYZ